MFLYGLCCEERCGGLMMCFSMGCVVKSGGLMTCFSIGVLCDVKSGGFNDVFLWVVL